VTEVKVTSRITMATQL